MTVRATLLLSLLIASSAVPAFAADDPLAEARRGKVQCYALNVAARTCQSIAAYRFAADGTIDNEAQVLLAPSGPVVMRSHSPVSVKDGAVCGPLRAEDIDRAEILAAGAPVTEAQASAVRGQIKAAMQSMIGAEICTTYTPTAGGLTASATVNRVAHPEMTMPVIWVAPADGYRVGG